MVGRRNKYKPCPLDWLHFQSYRSEAAQVAAACLKNELMSKKVLEDDKPFAVELIPSMESRIALIRNYGLYNHAASRRHWQSKIGQTNQHLLQQLQRATQDEGIIDVWADYMHATLMVVENGQRLQELMSDEVEASRVADTLIQELQNITNRPPPEVKFCGRIKRVSHESYGQEWWQVWSDPSDDLARLRSSIRNVFEGHGLHIKFNGDANVIHMTLRGRYQRVPDATALYSDYPDMTLRFDSLSLSRGKWDVIGTVPGNVMTSTFSLGQKEFV